MEWTWQVLVLRLWSPHHESLIPDPPHQASKVLKSVESSEQGGVQTKGELVELYTIDLPFWGISPVENISKNMMATTDIRPFSFSFSRQIQPWIFKKVTVDCTHH